MSRSLLSKGALAMRCQQSAVTTIGKSRIQTKVQKIPFSAPPSSSATGIARDTALIGFIGLGNMGFPMCMNLLRQDDGDAPLVTLLALDTNPDAVAKLAAESNGRAEAAGSVQDIGAASCDVVFTMLPSCDVVHSVYNGLIQGADNSSNDRSTLFVDCSTVAPSTSRMVHNEVVKKGHSAMDAPVSGGVKGATDGALTFMAGSDVASLEKAMPYLNRMGRAVIHCGGSGTGSATKLCNNLALAAQMAGICEAMNLGEALGVDPIVLADVMNASTAKCWSCEVNNPHPEVAKVRGMTAAAMNYEGGFASKLMLKDIGLAVEAAQEISIAVPIGASTKELYRMLDKRGMGAKDFGVLLQFLRGK
mmetsp:Transcript_30064/g.70424  ORF Transcript_30064/g.70424 Transcript_30064/m.70424 type:complete len:362 (+) Transcript_30064:72-1157(+)